MCFDAMEMLTSVEEKLVYSALPFKSNGFSKENAVSLIAEGSVGSFRYLALYDDNFKVARHDYSVARDTELIIREPDISFLGLSFVLKRDLHCNVEGLGRAVCRKDQYNLLHLPSVNVAYQCEKGEYTTFTIDIAKEYFSRMMDNEDLPGNFLGETEKQRPALLSPRHIYITGEMMSIISRFMLNLERGMVTKIYLQAKVLDLIRLAIERIKANDFPSDVVLTPEDERNIRDAFSYIISNLDHHIPLSLVAQKYELTTQKLSRGFKALNGIDLSTCILHERMQRAHSLLEIERKSVKETAKLTGYGSPQNLSSIFKDHFGYSPGSLLRPGKRSLRQ